jgi:hypothetical protein
MKKILLATTALMFASINANADTYTFTVTGILADASNTLGFGATKGSDFSAVFSIDTSLAMFDIKQPGLSEEILGGANVGSGGPSPITNASFTFLNQTYSLNPDYLSDFYVRNDGSHPMVSVRVLDSVGDDLYFEFNNNVGAPTPSYITPFSYMLSGTNPDVSFSSLKIHNSDFLVNTAMIGTITLDSNTLAVPGPIVGAGLPGLLGMLGLGGWKWRRRKVA